MTSAQKRELSGDEERYNHEREYWNQRAAQVISARGTDMQRPNLPTFEELCKYVTYLQHARDFYGPVAGKRFLDIGSGDGWISLSLAKSGALVRACDISPRLVELSNRYAKVNGLAHAVSFDVMAAEEITYPTQSFDCVIMHAALHHCDIVRTVEQIHRVVALGGKVVLIEDFAYHPLMRLYRVLTPGGHTRTERALDVNDLSFIASQFSACEIRYHGIVNLVETSCIWGASVIRPILRSVDARLYRYFPFLQRISKIVQLQLIK